VTRRIHKLQPIHPRVIAMSVARAMGFAFELSLPAKCTAYPV
jgi:hypothetical protein